MRAVTLPAYEAAEILDDYILVRLSAGKLVACDADHQPIGYIDVKALEAGQLIQPKSLNSPGTIDVQATGAVVVGDLLVAASAGKVVKDPVAGTRYVVGVALTAVSDGGVVEVLPYGYGHTLTVA